MFSIVYVIGIFLAIMARSSKDTYIAILSCIALIVLLALPNYAIAILIGYIVLYCLRAQIKETLQRFIPLRNTNRHNISRQEKVYKNRQERLNALKEAKIYLAPYKDIWSNLKMVNRYCVLKLGKDGKTIEGYEKKYPNRHFVVLDCGIYTSDELWNMFCRHFSWNKSYEGMIEDCFRYGTIIREEVGSESRLIGVNAIVDLPVGSYYNEVNDDNNNSTKYVQPVEKLDINNCSEAELTALPGISIVLAKKIVKKREEIGGFKNTDDFFLYIRLKEHMINQLKNMVKVEKMRGSVIKQLNTERKIDL